MTRSFLTNDNFYKYISNMRNNLTPCSIAIGAEYICFVNPQFKSIKREKIIDNELLKTKKGAVDPFNYHVSSCGKNSLKKLQKQKISFKL